MQSEPIVISERACRPFHIRGVDPGGGRTVVHEGVRYSEAFCRLRSFARTGTTSQPVLIVAPLAGGFAVLLRDLVVALLRHSRDVSITDWHDAAYVPVGAGSFTFEDSTRAVVRMIHRLGTHVHLIGVCEGAVSALAATAYLAAEDPDRTPASLVLLGGPIDPIANPTNVVRALRSHPLDWYEANVITSVPYGMPGEGRRVYSARLQRRVLGNYVARQIMEGGPLISRLTFDDGDDPLFHPLWLLSTSLMSLPAEHFLDTVKLVFQERAIWNGGMSLDGKTIVPAAINRTALMTIEAADDDIAAPGQTSAAHCLCTGVPDARRERLILPRGGHFSLFYGSSCRNEVATAIARFVGLDAAAH